MFDFNDSQMLLAASRDRLRQSFHGAVVHDLRNTLQVLAMTQSLAGAGDARIAAAIDKAFARLERTIAVLERLGADPASPIGPVAVGDILGFVAQAHESQRELPAVVVHVDAEPALPAVSGVAAALEHALFILVTRAKEAMSTSGGTVRIRAERRGGNVVVSVTDDGTGAHAESGLRPVRLMLERMGGAIQVLPDAQGIMIQLPVWVRPA